MENKEKYENDNLIQNDDWDNIEAERMNKAIRESELYKKEEKKRKRLKWKNRIKNIMIAILIVIIILLLLKRCSEGEDDYLIPVLDSEIAENIKTPNTEENKQDDSFTNSGRLYVTLPAMTDFSVSESKPEITIYCPDENKNNFELQYTFLNEAEEIIYQSEFLKAGERVGVNFKELLGVGEYTVRAKIASRYIDTKKAANGSGATIKITVK